MRREPDHLKALKGTLRTDRANPHAPRPPVVRTLKPRHGLSLPARREFIRLVGLIAPLRILAAADVIGIELLAEALCEYRRAAAVLARAGQTYPCRTAAGATLRRARPEVMIAAESWRRASSLLGAFGLHPSGRAGLKAEAVDDDGELARFLRERPAIGAARGRSGKDDPARFFRGETR